MPNYDWLRLQANGHRAGSRELACGAGSKSGGLSINHLRGHRREGEERVDESMQQTPLLSAVVSSRLGFRLGV